MNGLMMDLRFAGRMLRKSPLVTGAAVLSLALALGANTTIFTLFNAVFLRGLPVEEPERLAMIHTHDTNHGERYLPVSRPNYKDLRENNGVFSDLAEFFVVDANLAVDGSDPEQVTGRLVTTNYFSTLGVEAHAGRLFTDLGNDEVPGSEPLVVLSHRVWTRRFGADEGVLGTTVRLNRQPFTVVGVAPPGFTGVRVLGNPAFWVPVSMHQSILTGTLAQYFDHRRALISHVFGRLKDDNSITTARHAIDRLSRSLQEEYPNHNRDRSFRVVELSEAMVGVDERDGFLRAGGLLLTVVGLVLLIACANVANLLLARSASRRREIAVRLALGAPRIRIIRQLLIESLAMAGLAGLLGLAIALWARRALWSMRPPFLADSPIDLSFDPRVLGFTLLVTVLTGVLFGLVPALQASRPRLVTDLIQSSDSASGMARVLSFRNLLVAGQIALSVVALVGSGLFLRSLNEATKVDVGFEPNKLAVMSFNLGLAGYDDAGGESLFDRIVEHVGTIPGVEDASLTTIMPFTGRDHFQRTVMVEGRGPRDDNNAKMVPVTTTDADFFTVLGVELLRGRELSAQDRADGAPVAVINEAMAELFWSGEDAIGQRFSFLGQDVVREIVGIVETTKFQAIGESPQPLVYVPRQQNYVPAMSLVTRAAGAPETILGTLQSELRTLEPSLAITGVQTGGAAVEQALWAPRMAATLLAILGLLALILAAIGIYGVTAYTVSQRRRELSIRMAMGAGRGTILQLVLSQGLKVAALGLGLGAVAAFLAGRSIAALLHGVSPADPLTFALTTLVLALVAAGANFMPSMRATTVDPAATLRFER